MKRIVKTFLQNIKLWGWYDWLKYLLATFLVGLVMLFAIFALYMGITDPDFAFDYTIILAAIVFVLFGAFVFSPFLSIAYLIIKDFRLPHIILIILNGIGVYQSAVENMWDYVSVVNIVFILVSMLCIYKITVQKKPKKKDKTEDTLSILSLVVIVFWMIWLPFVLIMGAQFPDSDFEIEEECVATKIEKGYPQKFAKEYCWGEGRGCVEKGYEENCEVGLKCCFATIEEDKKWNYLDYDKEGKKIIKGAQ